MLTDDQVRDYTAGTVFGQAAWTCGRAETEGLLRQEREQALGSVDDLLAAANSAANIAMMDAGKMLVLGLHFAKRAVTSTGETDPMKALAAARVLCDQASLPGAGPGAAGKLREELTQHLV